MKNIKIAKKLWTVCLIAIGYVILPICTQAQTPNAAVEQLLNERYGKHTHSVWQDKYYRITKDSKVGLTDLQGKEILPPVYDGISKDELGNLEVNITYKNKVYGPYYGIYTPEGKMLLPVDYTFIDVQNYYATYNIYEVQQKKKSALFDTLGVEILPLDYYYIRSFSSVKGKNRIIVSVGGDRNTFMNNIPVGSKFGIFDIDRREWTVRPTYDFIDYLIEKEGLARFNKGGQITGNSPNQTCTGGLWGYMDVDGKVLIPARYESATRFQDGIATVTQGGVASVLTNPLTGTKLQLANGTGGNSVDANIPQTSTTTENTFAFIIANQNYTHYGKGDYALNDGKVFKDYCINTLGMPKNNVRFYEDATYGNIIRAIETLKNIAEVYEGDAAIILYYAGLGATDAQSSVSYLLPTDANPSALEATGYSLQKLSDAVAGLNTRYSLILVDAGFAGTDCNGQLLEKNRAVQLASKQVLPRNNTIVFTAAGSKETAFAQKELAHGLFTHALLTKLQQSKGECTLGEVADYIITTVKKESMKTFSKLQTPTLKTPIGMDWKRIKLNQ